MSTVAEKITYLNDTKSAIKNALVARGVSVSNSDTFRSYADKIGEIGETVVVEKEITKYGASVNTFLGDVDENGVLQATLGGSVDLDFSNVEEVADFALCDKFLLNSSIKSANFSSLKKVGTCSLQSAFSQSSIETADFGQLTVIDHQGLEGAFFRTPIKSINFDLLEISGISAFMLAFCECRMLESINFNSLRIINEQALWAAFSYCEKLRSINFDTVENIDFNGLYSAFNGCTSLISISFPSLVEIEINAFTITFNNCTSLTEIHFRADMQETIEATDGYSEKWGASNATVYFDLIGTITVDGVTYTRDEKQSIRVDGVKTFVGWQDANDNLVYTSYADNAEPVVDTVVYSDAGTTQVGTVEVVA